MTTDLRIVSLLPCATEIVAALGLGDRLVARSHECDEPAEVVRLPHVSAPRLDVSAPGAEIHASVGALVGRALSIYEVDAAALAALRPDVILTQTQCAVCAVSLDDVASALAACGATGARIVALEPHRLDDVWTDMKRVADALGVADRGQDLVDRLRARMGALARRAADADGRPRVAAVEWLTPPMIGGNWMPELLDLAGAEPLLATAGTHSAWIDVARIAESDPDVVLVLPCGFDLARTRAEYAAFAADPAWNRLRAVRAGRVALIDGHAFFNRPGPRLVESLEILCEILHPDLFAARHLGRGWDWA